jgi:hypothetical protein
MIARAAISVGLLTPTCETSITFLGDHLGQWVFPVNQADTRTESGNGIATVPSEREFNGSPYRENSASSAP